MTEVDPSAPLIDVFEGRTQLFVSYHMWHDGHTAADQCEGCTFFTGQVRELSYLHQRDVTFAVFCQDPLIPTSGRYHRGEGALDHSPGGSRRTPAEESGSHIRLGFGDVAVTVRFGAAFKMPVRSLGPPYAGDEGVCCRSRP
jgi:hypothetical protein